MASDKDRERFDKALRMPQPKVALHDLALALKAEGMAQADLYQLFAEYQLKTNGNDPRYDSIVDNMDLIYGGAWAKGHGLYEA